MSVFTKRSGGVVTGTPSSKTAPTKSLPVAHLVLVLVAAGVAIPAYSGGVVLSIEIVFALVLPVLLHFVMRDTFLRLLWLVASVWGVAQITSDLLHGTQLFSAPTWIGPTAALLATGLYWVQTRLKVEPAAVLFAVGVGWSVLQLLAGDISTNQNPWKYALSTPITVTVLAFAYHKRLSTQWILLALAVLAATSLYFDSRFQFALHIGCAVFVLAMRTRTDTGERKPKRLLVFLLLGAAIVYLGYPTVALTGAIGDRAYQQQVTYEAEGANYLLATRMEFPQLLYLVGQNPMLGIGSYAQLNSEQAYDALEFVNDKVAPLTENDKSYLLSGVAGSPGYNAHTAAMSSALYAGIFALPFWFFVLSQIFVAVRHVTSRSATVGALTIYMSGLAFWDALFSPLTNQSHVSLAVTLFLCLAQRSTDESKARAGSRSLTGD